MKKLLSFAFTSILIASSIIVSAQAPTRGNVAILLDLSGSMNAELDGESRRDVAVEALTKTVGEIDGNASIALYAFGNNFDNSPSSKAQSCEDINQLVDYGKNNSGAIKEVLSGIEAKGWTPLAKSITTIGSDLSQFGDSEHHLIILSDGEESCNGDPVGAVETLKANGVNVIINTIGLDVDANTKAQLEGIADAGGGEYFDAADSGALANSLKEAVVETETAEPQEDADFSAEYILPMGGSSFEDAVELSMDYFDGETYSFPKHLEEGKNLTYKLSGEFLDKDPEFTIGGILAANVEFNESNEVIINEDDNYSSVNYDFFNKRKASILQVRVSGKPNDSIEKTVKLEDEDIVYLFIGDEDEGFNKNNKIYFEYDVPEEDVLDEEESEDIESELEDSDEVSVDEDDSNTEVDASDDQVNDAVNETTAFLEKDTAGVKNLYLVLGLVGIVLFLIILLVVLNSKKKNQA